MMWLLWILVAVGYVWVWWDDRKRSKRIDNLNARINRLEEL